MTFVLREAWHEFRCGMRNGIAPLILLVLTGYLLMVLSNADYMRDMGAVEVPRNAPSLVFLMTSGDSFFLLFAWAWIFAQPIIRDRKAQLHEVILAAPQSLSSLLTARYLGALGVALVVGSSQVAGFLLSPMLEWVGAIPPGSLGPTPWQAFAQASLLFTLPLAAGAGALYFIAAIKTRGVGGPFVIAAALMAFWMVSMVVFKDSHANAFLGTVMDPSGFAETERQVVDNWTPRQKANSMLAVSEALLWNRILWCGLPLMLLSLVIWRTTRDSLVLEGSGKGTPHRPSPRVYTDSLAPRRPVRRPNWWRAAIAESYWQTRQTLWRSWMLLAILLLILLGVAGTFVHGVHHAHGPLVPRPEFVAPLLTTLFYLIIVFMVTGLIGIAARRDHQPGLEEILDAAPAPAGIRLVGRVVAAAVVTIVLALVPACGGILATALVAPQHVQITFPLLYQLSVLAPALLEVAALTLLIHALVLRPGPAYAASVLAAFVMVVNNEAGLVSYPPLQIGLPVPITVSGATGLAPWAEKLLISNGFKLAIMFLLVAIAGIVMLRGTEWGWRLRTRSFLRRLAGPGGGTLTAAFLALLGMSVVMHQRYIIDAGYQNQEQRLASDARWESLWLAHQQPFSVTGGDVKLVVDTDRQLVTGYWRLRGVKAGGNALHAGLPHGLRIESVLVGGKQQHVRIEEEHLALELGACPSGGCTIEIAWSMPITDWNADHRPPWLTQHGYWLQSRDVMPRLGFANDRVLRPAHDRLRLGLPANASLPGYRATLPSGAAAPAGRWTWQVTRVSGPARSVRHGHTDGLLDFADVWAPALVHTGVGRLSVIHDKSRREVAMSITDDLADMQACVARRLGTIPNVDHIAQWPRGLGNSRVAGRWLLLAENPHWDIANEGVGRWVRRAEIATVLAGRSIKDTADLRDGKGALLLSKGLPGAIGLRCVAEVDGLEALKALLSRGSDRVTEALAASPVPIGPLENALGNDWGAEYAPLAVLHWASRQTPAGIARLLDEARTGGDLNDVLVRFPKWGTTMAQMLGSPNATDLRVGGRGSQTDVEGERFQWQDGGWVAANSAPRPWQFPLGNSDLDGPARLYLDTWPAYERTPADNTAQFSRESKEDTK